MFHVEHFLKSNPAAVVFYDAMDRRVIVRIDINVSVSSTISIYQHMIARIETRFGSRTITQIVRIVDWDFDEKLRQIAQKKSKRANKKKLIIK